MSDAAKRVFGPKAVEYVERLDTETHLFWAERQPTRSNWKHVHGAMLAYRPSAARVPYTLMVAGRMALRGDGSDGTFHMSGRPTSC